MNRKNFLRTLLFTCWLPFVCAGLGAVHLADNAAYAHHSSLGWETPVEEDGSTSAQPSMPADQPTIPDASLPARYRLEGAVFGFLSGTLISVLAATVAGGLGPLPPPARKRPRNVMA